MASLGRYFLAVLLLAITMVVLFGHLVPSPVAGIALLTVSLGIGVAVSVAAYRTVRTVGNQRPPLWMRVSTWLAGWAVAAGLVYGANWLFPGVFTLVRGFWTAAALTFLPLLSQLDVKISWLPPFHR